MATIANRNGHNMVQHFLLPVNIHFHWNLFIFEFLTIFFIFYIGGHFENFKNKEHNFEWRSILCQVSKGSAVRGVFNIFSTLVTVATTAFLNLFNTQKLPYTMMHITTKFDEVWWKESKNFLNAPFLFPWQLRQSLPNRFRFFLLISFH